MQHARLKLSALAMMLALIAPAHAHTKLTHSTPADNAVLAESPGSLSLQFSKPARLTAVTLLKTGERDAVKLGPLSKSVNVVQDVPLSALGPGEYLVTWRVTSDDNHVMSGKLRFTVQGKSK